MAEKINPNCRIGKITLKNGRNAGLSIFKSRRVDKSEWIKAEFLRVSDDIASNFDDDMAGFYVIAWDWHGRNSEALRNDDECAVSSRLLPQWLAELVRAHVVSEDTILIGNAETNG